MAHHVETKNKVALKLLNSQLATEDGTKLFNQEADLLTYFRHPNILKSAGSGEYYGCKYLAMDYAEGECLDKIMKRYDVIPQRMVLSIISQACDALDYAWNSFGIRPPRSQARKYDDRQ